MGSKGLIMKVAGVDDREAAESLRAIEIWARRSDFPALESGEFYYADLEGAIVYRTGQEVGCVDRVIEYPGGACLEVRSADGVREVPIAGDWILAIDAERSRITAGDWSDIELLAPAAGDETGEG